MTTISTELSLHNRRHHRRSDSGELDVFDAMSYFCGESEERSCHGSSMKNSNAHHNIVREGSSVADDSFSTNVVCQPHAQKKEKKQKSEKKPKTPKSPGSRLASLLNSLFSPTAGKKKPKPSAVNDCDENACERRKKRSSICHLQSVSDNTSKSLYSSSSVSDFETPSSFNSSTARFYKEFDDIRNDLKLKRYPTIRRSLTLFPSTGVSNEKRCINVAFLEQNFIFSESCLDKEDSNYKRCLRNENGYTKDGELTNIHLRKDRKFEKESKNIDGDRTKERGREERKRFDKFPFEKRTKKIEEQQEDGFMSDSSSDLFELQNYDIGGDYSNGLPVYATTI